MRGWGGDRNGKKGRRKGCWGRGGKGRWTRAALWGLWKQQVPAASLTPFRMSERHWEELGGGERERERLLSPALKGPPQEVLILPRADTPHQQQRKSRKKSSFKMSGGEWEDPHPPLRGVLISKLSLSGMERNVSKKERFSVFYDWIWILICVREACNQPVWPFLHFAMLNSKSSDLLFVTRSTFLKTNSSRTGKTAVVECK